MKYPAKAMLLFLVIVFLQVGTDASSQEDAAAKTIAAAFNKARVAAHRPALEVMDNNKFRQQACSAAGTKQGMRFPSGLINDVTYQTADPNILPTSAKQLAEWPDTSKVAKRVGIGVCIAPSQAANNASYSVVIAIYESSLTSFFRIFWE